MDKSEEEYKQMLIDLVKNTEEVAGEMVKIFLDLVCVADDGKGYIRCKKDCARCTYQYFERGRL